MHIVMFQYKPAVTASVKNDISSAFIALKDSCRLPDGSKYILSLDGGLNNSPEGMTKGLEVRGSLLLGTSILPYADPKCSTPS